MMSTAPMPLGPMLLMENTNQGTIYHEPHQLHPGPPQPQIGNNLPANVRHQPLVQPAPSGQHLITSSMNRSQRF